MNDLSTLFAALSGPLFLHENSARRVQADLNAMVAFLAADPRGRLILAGTYSDVEDDPWQPYKVSSDGTLSVPVQGVLLAGVPYSIGRYATGYPYIEATFKRGMADPNVRRIALVIDSPGGMVSGCFDCVDAMATMGDKPVRSFAADSAYSAAYAIATVGDQIVVTRTGGVGSIGVVTAHVDLSKMMEQEGIKVTFISAPKDGYKTEGNPYEPLTGEAIDRIQARIDGLYAEFVATVATNRGMSAEEIRATKALTYGAAQSIDVGLADSISRLDTGLANFAADTSTTGVSNMAKTFTQEEYDAALAQAVEVAAIGGTKQGTLAERARIVAIMGGPEAEKRPIAARSLALETSMTAEEAAVFLKKIPEERPAGPTPEQAHKAAFEKAMGKDNPELHQSGADDGEETDSSRIARSFAASGGRVRALRSAT